MALYKLSDLETMSSTDLKCRWAQQNVVLEKYKPMPLLESQCYNNQCKRHDWDGEMSKDESAAIVKKLLTVAPKSSLALFSNRTYKLSGNNSVEKREQISITIENCKTNNILLDLGENRFLHECCSTTYTNLFDSPPLEIAITNNKNVWSRERKFRITASRCYLICTREVLVCYIEFVGVMVFLHIKIWIGDARRYSIFDLNQ